MSDSDGENGAGGSDTEALESAKVEARWSFDQTIASIESIDDTAVSIFRINLVIISLVLTGLSSFPASLRFMNAFSVAGFAFLVLSSFAAVITNMGSDYPTGISSDHLGELRDATWTETEWNEWIVREYQEWLADANQMAAGDARALFVTQVLLGIGILLLIVGVVLGVFGLVDPLPGVRATDGVPVSVQRVALCSASLNYGV